MMRARIIRTIILMLVICGLAFLAIPKAKAPRDYHPANTEEQAKALGSMKELQEQQRQALSPGPAFPPLPPPKPGDWLAEHREPGQTFDEYVSSRPNRPDDVRRTIYLKPLGEMPGEESLLLTQVRDFAEAYFAMEVVLLPAVSVENEGLTTRINSNTKKRQILSTDVLGLMRRLLPHDAFCILAVTMEDLYPEPSWNFVFGQASLQERVGVYSFARYDPAFYGESRQKDYRQVLLRRSCQVMAHETAHMFGLWHCIYFSCVCNGSNNLEESDSQPLHLCPVCLRKLQYAIGFDVAVRYEKLREFCDGAGMASEAKWASDRIGAMTRDKTLEAK